MRNIKLGLIAMALCACSTSPVTSNSAGTAVAYIRPIDVPAIERPAGETAEWWFRSGAAAAAERGSMQGEAKNVILFVGDGMSLVTVAAARIHAGQQLGGSGEEHLLSWETFPYTALSRTYNTNQQTPDSAGTATAFNTGVKTRAGVINITQLPRRGDCTDIPANALLNIRDLAESAGMATGVVTTARITHATPATTYAYGPDRDWEDDSQLSEAALEAGCQDFARQLVEPRYGRGPDVMFGGGRRHFLPLDQSDPEHTDKSGRRRDGRDLIRFWQEQNPDGSYVWNRRQLQAASERTPILGLFEYDHMHFELDRPGQDPEEPSLEELTREAIRRLQTSETGYFLMVEGGRIDHAHHYGNASRALVDTVAMADAVQAAMELTSEDDTLILVTADHAHTLTFAGYPQRGNPILGKVRRSTRDGSQGPLARDGLGLPYTTLGYANGPGYTGASASQPAGPKGFFHPGSGYQPAIGRPDLSEVDTEHPDYLQESVVPLADETHGGEDVGIWARGAGAHAVRGTVEQNVIFHFMVQATPRLRERLCEAGLCNADGVPVQLPRPQAFLPADE